MQKTEAKVQEEKRAEGKKIQEMADEIATNLESLPEGNSRSDRSI